MKNLHIKGLVATVIFALSAIAAQADSKHPNIDAICAKNPTECKQIDAQVAAQCAESPAACAKGKANMEKKLGELKAECDANPVACEEKKKKFYENLEQRR